MAGKDHCEICDDAGKYDLRVQTLEENYEKLEGSLKEYKQDMYKKLDRFQTYLIVNLTAIIISLLLLLANLIVTYGGK